MAGMKHQVEVQGVDMARLRKNQAVTLMRIEGTSNWSRRADAALAHVVDSLMSTGELESEEMEDIEPRVNELESKTGAT
ncbi:hypothetical protein LTR66_013577 [Elasticomyces elasticus]|nr:hypothetical protein LTR66_013577 [Elasticomyces elasticus]